MATEAAWNIFKGLFHIKLALTYLPFIFVLVDNVPVVLVLAEGDMTSIHHVVEAVKINTIVYIIKGTGKAADLIVDYLHE